MTVAEMVEQLGLQVRAGTGRLDRPVTGGHVGDLLSSVMAKSAQGQVWVTIQSHPNIVAVAALLELAVIIVVEGVEPEPATLARAQEQGVTVLTTTMGAFETVGKLYQLGVH